MSRNKRTTESEEYDTPEAPNRIISLAQRKTIDKPKPKRALFESFESVENGFPTSLKRYYDKLLMNTETFKLKDIFIREFLHHEDPLFNNDIISLIGSLLTKVVRFKMTDYNMAREIIEICKDSDHLRENNHDLAHDIYNSITQHHENKEKYTSMQAHSCELFEQLVYNINITMKLDASSSWLARKCRNLQNSRIYTKFELIFLAAGGSTCNMLECEMIQTGMKEDLSCRKYNYKGSIV